MNGTFADALASARAPLLFGVRLWASVCLALFVAFWLELDNPFWAGTSAALVCQPQLGAALRKGWFRMIGTAVGATTIVALTACFPQDRIAFFALLALWGGVCAFAATMLRNFASYAAALAGYTAAIIGADTLGATGGASPEVFMLAITRAAEICIGIVCAGIVLAGTDFGGTQRRLAASLADLTVEIARRFTGMLVLAGSQLPDTQAELCEFVRRVSALDPMIDQALGESSHVRDPSPTLQTAVDGLFTALDGWRAVAAHLNRAADDGDRRAAETILSSIPTRLRAAAEPGAPARWMADPLALRCDCEAAAQTLLALPADAPSPRLLADETAKLFGGLACVLDGLALLVDAADRPSPDYREVRRSMPDWLPALVNGVRAFVAIGAVELLWVATAWPNGAFAIVYAAVTVLLLSPKGDLAYHDAIAFAVATIVSIVCAATIEFAVLPGVETFPAFCLAIGLFHIPVGFAIAQSRQPALMAVLGTLDSTFVPLLSPTNPMTYDTAQFYNLALAIFIGCGVAPLAFRLLPNLSSALRTDRLLARTLRDLRRLAIGSRLPTSADWTGRMHARLAELPDQAEPLQRSQLLAALSIGVEISQLRRLAPPLGVATALYAALVSFAQGQSRLAIAQLRQLDRHLSSGPATGPESADALRARGRLTVIAETLDEHGSYFDSRAPG